MLGFGAYQFLFAADTVFVRTYLPKQSDCYAAAGTLSRALIWAAGALVAVMFPKLVRSAVRAEKTDVMGLTLLCTAAIAGAGVVGLWVVGPWMVRLIYTSFTPEDVETTTRLLAWYAAAMVPLALASVLVNGLLARSDFRVVPVLMALAVAYGITLLYVHSSLVVVVQVLGTYNLVLLAVCALFNWGVKPRQPAAA